jgi:iron complex outermembrane receptor protein
MTFTIKVAAQHPLHRIGACWRPIAGLLVISASLSGNAGAADTPSQPTLTEIIVTAQKRQENIQDVPISVMAVSGQELQDAGVKDIKNLQVLTPGVTVTSTTSENVTTARIRGVGTVGDNPGLESSVGVIIDGVYRPRNGVGFGDLGEIEQIEVLEGPQGELFGKNNDAGVINVVTKQLQRSRDFRLGHGTPGRDFCRSVLRGVPEARWLSQCRHRSGS